MEKTGIRLALAGDVMIGRLVDREIARRGFAFPWGDTLPLLRGADLRLMNLETVLTRSRNAVPKVFNFRAEPEAVQSLVEAGLDAVNLANNHVLDFGEEGLRDTLRALDGAGIRHVGAGLDAGRAREPVVLEAGGMRIGVLGMTDNEPSWKAGTDRPGTWQVDIGNEAEEDEVVAAIRALRPRVDLVVLSIHWGPNMIARPPPAFRAFAHKAAAAGVDILHGHSAHVFQGIERIGKSLILYDTGDIIDDYVVEEYLRNDLTFLFLVRAEPAGPSEVELVPMRIDGMQVNRASGEDYRQCVDRMAKLCRELGTEVPAFSRAPGPELPA